MTDYFQPSNPNKVVDFEDFNQIKKKAVRGLLRKRAKKYTEDQQSSAEDSEPDTKKRQKKKVQKDSMSAAFAQIMNKHIQSDDSDAPKSEAKGDLTLVKYKKKSRELDARREQEEEAHRKRLQKE